MITSTYFAFTTLSTVGLGDYYPVSDLERLVGSFFLLLGVATFSYMMGELVGMILRWQSLDLEVAEEDELDKFFTFLRLYNHGEGVDRKVQNEIRAFLLFKWS